MELYLDCAVGGILHFFINSLYTDFEFNDVESTEVFDCERFAPVNPISVFNNLFQFEL